MTQRSGMLEYHSSEADGSPEVGVLLHIDSHNALWVGEITSREALDLNVTDAGWHFVHRRQGEKIHIGFVPDNSPAIDLMEALAATGHFGDASSDPAATLEQAISLAMEPHVNKDMAEPFKRAWLADLTRAALTAISKASYAVVPVEPTPDMIAKAWGEISKEKRLSGIAKLGPGPAAREIYRAMIAANGEAACAEIIPATPLGGDMGTAETSKA